MISTGNGLIITKVLEVHKIIVAQRVKGGYFLNELINFRQHVSHSVRVKVFHQTTILTCPVISGGLVMKGNPVFTRLTGPCCVDYWANKGTWSLAITPLKLDNPKWCLAISVIKLRPSFHLSGKPLVSGNVVLRVRNEAMCHLLRSIKVNFNINSFRNSM